MGSGKIQGALWNSSAHNWCELQEPLQKPQWEAIFDEVNLTSNSNFLDAGCGGGGTINIDNYFKYVVGKNE